MDAHCIDNNYAATNPDIAGIGVRVSFYLQTFLLVILVDRSWQDAPIALWTFIATSFGLTIATVVQHQSNAQLTLFQGLQVSNLVWLANFGTFVALASYSRQKAASNKETHAEVRPDYNVKFGAMVQTLFSMALTLYMWSHAGTFGSIPECSYLVNYMVFAIKVPALGTGKIIGLTASSVLTAAYLLISLHEVRSYRRSRAEEVAEPELLSPSWPTNKRMPSSLSVPITEYDSPLPSVYSIPSRTRPGTALSGSRRPVSSRRVEQVNRQRRPRRRRWAYEIDPMLIGIMICQITVFTYFIVSSELLLTYNTGAYTSAQQMGFGQILALIVVLPSALSVLGALKEHGLRRLSKRKKIEVRRRKQVMDDAITEPE